MKYNFYKMSETVVIGAVVRAKRPPLAKPPCTAHTLCNDV